MALRVVEAKQVPKQITEVDELLILFYIYKLKKEYIGGALNKIRVVDKVKPV